MMPAPSDFLRSPELLASFDLRAAFWIIPLAAFGAVVGSFLNVVIYRLPRGLSIASPRRSMCPSCETTIRPIDNIPVFSWLLLRGRCRRCRAVIAITYPVVEMLCVLVFLMVWDALFVSGNIAAISSPRTDWPVALAYLALFAGLLACSVMDIEEYLIDVRVPNFIMVVGVLLHALWGVTGRGVSDGAFGPAASAVGVAFGLGWVATWLLSRARGAGPLPSDPSLDASAATPDAIDQPTPLTPQNPDLSAVLLLLFAVMCCALLEWHGDLQRHFSLNPSQQRALVAIFVFLVVLILAGMTTRESDHAMDSIIREEQHRARGMAVREFIGLLPSILAGGAVIAILAYTHKGSLSWSDLPASFEGRPLGALAGAASAAASLLFAAGVGWFVRIFFTLVFGKEAYGVGDIFLMAAIAAVGGLWLALIAFFLGSLLASVGAIVFWIKKSSRTLPFGPWLSLGALAGLWVHDPLVAYVGRTLQGLRMMWAAG